MSYEMSFWNIILIMLDLIQLNYGGMQQSCRQALHKQPKQDIPVEFKQFEWKPGTFEIYVWYHVWQTKTKELFSKANFWSLKRIFLKSEAIFGTLMLFLLKVIWSLKLIFEV